MRHQQSSCSVRQEMVLAKKKQTRSKEKGNEETETTGNAVEVSNVTIDAVVVSGYHISNDAGMGLGHVLNRQVRS